MSFFSQHRNSIQISADLGEDEGLWDCQQGAYWSLQSHFVTHDKRTPAIVSLPTGSGKTALMMVMAFARECKRVLIVAPSKVVRHQISNRFDELDDLEKAGILTGDLTESDPARPDVNEITGHVGPDEWEKETNGSDVVVALPQSISPKYGSADSEIALPPKEKFDLVLFDEGHHASAPTWKALVNHFSETERILLTATAFRRDRSSLPGKIAYHYPVNKAVEDGIYQPLKYKPIGGSADKSDLNPVCKAAEEVLSDLRESNVEESNPESTRRDDESTEKKNESSTKPALLARTNTTDKADDLADAYEEVGLDVKPVHSDRTSKQNEDTIDELNSGQIDGIVGVNAISEGLDTEQLQVAALHELPKSFPFTYQLLGRIARSSAIADQATIVADSEAIDTDAMREAVQRLYAGNTAWGELVPSLVDQFVNRQEDRERHGPADLIDVFEETELNPHQSLRLYDASEVDDWKSNSPETRTSK